ncbi:general transcription factor IIIC subunit 1 [Salmo trutta]|uniref:general transcription factor 3C polypeptide 1 n=1 Tax=Salmo trutta TaxID=8032 RepID=UPI00113265A6|nr:general transcription factor 3C polypeptide 1-like [Salmo trutta]
MDPLDIVMDEVALEGLDGVTILSLWIRLEKRNPAFPRNLDPYTKEFIWKSLVSNHEVDFYELPQERADVVLVDRFADIDPDTGIQEASCWDRVDSYPVQILLEDKRGIQGSCVFFKERRNVTPIIRTTDLTPRLTLEDAFKRWGRKLVMVASQRVRFRVLIGDGGDPDMKLTDHSYCILERLGRARWQGELQRDLHSCSFKTDPRKMHYLRKSLTQNDLITMQSHVIRLASGAQQHSILLLLKRFHVDRRSKYDILMELTSNLLSEAPNHIASMITLRDQLSISERTFKRMYQYMQAAKLVQVVIKPVEHLNPTVGTCDTRRGMYPTHYLTTSTLQTVYLYVKRNCMIVDTTMCEPHYNLVLETRVFERRRYTLNTLTDVDNYWFDLMCVCLNTPLGVIRKERPKRSSASKSQEGPVKVPVDTDRHKFRHLDHMLKGSREVCYAAVIPGDSKGAGGLDSDFFGHLKRNWIWTCHLMRTKRSNNQYESSNTVRLNSLLTKHLTMDIGPKFPGPLSSKQGVPAGLRLEEVHISTEPSSRNLLVKGGNKRKRKRTVKQVKIPQKKKKVEVRKRAPVHDAADHKALMMMTRQRVTWSVSEDSVLILCRVASHFLNRKLRRPFVPWCVVRDLLHAEFEESLDKTSPSVGRRSRYILKNPQTHLNYKICLAEVYQDKPLIGKLQGRKHNPNDPEECSTVFREFVSLLRQKFSSASGSCDVTIPDTKTQLFSRFKVYTLEDMSDEKTKDSLNSIEDIHSLVLNNLIQSTLAMSNSQMKCCRSFQTFHTYSRYRQEVLCQVFVQCRKKGLVNRRRISQLCGPNKNRALPILPMSYQLSQSYYRCFTWRLPTGLCTEVFDFMQALSRNGTGDNHPSTAFIHEGEEKKKRESMEKERGEERRGEEEREQYEDMEAEERGKNTENEDKAAQNQAEEQVSSFTIHGVESTSRDPASCRLTQTEEPESGTAPGLGPSLPLDLTEMLQFPLESPGGATLACLSLMTLGLLSVHVSIPEHIVVLDSTMVDNEVVKSISVLAEDDDDDEEESEGRRGIEVRAHKASHTKYLMMRGYCVPGIVNLRNLNTNDSIVVESCTMRLHLRHTPVHTLFITQDSPPIDFSRHGPSLLPSSLTHSLRAHPSSSSSPYSSPLPVSPSSSVEVCEGRLVTQRGYSPEDIGAVAELRATLERYGAFGLDRRDLVTSHTHLADPRDRRTRGLQQYIQDLLEEELVLEVGGNSVRLVLLSHAEPWLLTSTERQRDRPHQAQQGASAFGDRKHHNPLLRKRRMVAPREQEPRSKRGRRETLMEEEEVEKRGETSEEEEERKKMQPEEKDRNETAEERWMKRAEEEEEMEKEERVQEEPSSTIETGQSTEGDGEKPFSSLAEEEDGEAIGLREEEEGSVGVCDVSFISRPWRIVDGSLNRPVCKGMLEAVLYHIMTRPGLPEHILLEHYRGVLQPVVVLDLVQALVELGCIKKKYVTRRPKPSLFSRPAAFLMEEDRAGETGVRLGETGVRPAETTTVFYEPTIDCCLRLGQVLPHENNWNQWVQFAQHENKQ